MLPPASRSPRETAARSLEVFLVAGRLGVTSFGGPIAHIGYFRDEYVRRRRWLDEGEFAELVGLSQSLPGPASTQLGIAIGMLRAGFAGGVAAWFAFTAPSAVALIALAGVFRRGDLADAGWVQGLQLVAVAVVAQAVWSMARTLATDWRRRILAAAAAATVLLWAAPLAQVAVIGAGALIGLLVLDAPDSSPRRPLHFGIRRRTGLVAIGLFVALLVALPAVERATDSHWAETAQSFYRSGALVFGGGHLVLPLLESQVVPPGWVSEQDFLAGYGAAQAVPGPLFTFAGYLGAIQDPEPNGVAGGTLATVAIFLPAFLLVAGALPFWAALRSRPAFLTALAGINAAVVGLLAAALYRPVFTSGVDGPLDLVIALLALAVLLTSRVPVWAVVLGCALAGLLLL